MKLLLIIAMLFSSCSSNDDYVSMVDKATNAFAKKMKQKHKLSVYGTGGGMMDNVWRVMIALEGRQPLNLDQARQLYVEGAEIYLKRINDDEKLRPHLANYPFEITNLDLSMAFVEKPGVHRRGGDIAYVHNYNNSTGSGIAYYTSPDGEKLDLVHEELYSEALQKVKASGAFDNIQHLPAKW